MTSERTYVWPATQFEIHFIPRYRIPTQRARCFSVAMVLFIIAPLLLLTMVSNRDSTHGDAWHLKHFWPYLAWLSAINPALQRSHGSS